MSGNSKNLYHKHLHPSHVKIAIKLHYNGSWTYQNYISHYLRITSQGCQIFKTEFLQFQTEFLQILTTTILRKKWPQPPKKLSFIAFLLTNIFQDSKISEKKLKRKKNYRIMPHSQKFGLKSKSSRKRYKIAALTAVIKVVRFQACLIIWRAKKAKIWASSSQSEYSYKFSK